MDRRTFLSWVGLGWLASSLPVAIAACTSEQVDSKPAQSPSFRPVGTLTQLTQSGSILNKEKTPVLVIGDAKDTKTLVALNPTCTHRGCIVDWKADRKAFVCPCHDAQFDAQGKVLKGPADKPLPAYLIKIEQDTILVNA